MKFRKRDIVLYVGPLPYHYGKVYTLRDMTFGNLWVMLEYPFKTGEEYLIPASNLAKLLWGKE